MAGVGCPCGWPLDSCNPELAKDEPCGKERHEAEVRQRLGRKQVPLRLEDDEIIGTAVVNEQTGQITAKVTDPKAAARLATVLGDDLGSFSIAPARKESDERP